VNKHIIEINLEFENCSLKRTKENEKFWYKNIREGKVGCAVDSNR
jgi:hypothetical protein